MSSLPHQEEVRGNLDLRVRRLTEAMSLLKSRYGNLRTDKNCSPHFGLGTEKGSQSRHEPGKMKSANKHVRTRKYRKKIQGLCLLSLYLT